MGVTYLRGLLDGSTSEPKGRFDGIPAPHAQLLQQIETQGWHMMKWKDGYTMLHWAAQNGHEDLCRYLVQLGADPAAKDGQDLSPADFARDNGHEKLARIIRELCMSV